jgi:MoxR-like ATPase
MNEQQPIEPNSPGNHPESKPNHSNFSTTEAGSEDTDIKHPEYTRVNVEPVRTLVQHLEHELGKVIIGQEVFIRQLIATLLAGGHALIEGVPGIAKTLTAKMLSRACDLPFKRIQFTPDLMPSDVLGTAIFDIKSTDFTFREGPIFSNIILIDEINRARRQKRRRHFFRLWRSMRLRH